MASRRLLFAGGAICASIGLHALGFGLSHRSDVAMVEGGAPTSVAILGNSFADMVAGVEKPVEVTRTPTEPVAPTTAVQPQVQPETSTAVQPEIQATPVTQNSTPSITPQPATAAAKPAVIAPVAKPVPKTRPKPAPKPVRKPVKEAKPDPKPAPKGNGSNNEKRGQSDGSTTAKASTSGTASGRSTQAGNAAVSNYPGKVWRKLQRTRKRGRGRGKAVVGFKIAASGGVASAWIIRSSGDAKLDAAAVKHVHRAAPFPKPPQGAKRQFSYEYVVK